MKKRTIIILVIFICFIGYVQECNADNSAKASAYMKKAANTKIKEAKYDYLNKARDLYLKDYEENPVSIETLKGLSRVNRMLGDRKEAKVYTFIAYNLHPEDSLLQKETGDFFYDFGEYSTAIEYYKLALSNGLLRDYETNIRTAECYEKLGDTNNAELYYKISAHVNPSSRVAANKLNAYSSENKIKTEPKKEEPEYKYLFKQKTLPGSEQTEIDAEKIINELNSGIN